MTKPTTELAEVIRIQAGGHRSFADGACAMELVSYMAHETYSDHPKCASPVLAAFVRPINDRMDDDTRQKLAPYLIRLIGTVGTRGQEQTRAYMLADWACRVAAPMALRTRGFTTEAARLAALAPVIDKETANTAIAAAYAAIAAAYAAATANTAIAAAYAAATANAAYAAYAAASVWDSALDLLDRLIAVTETQTPTVCAVPERVEELRRAGVAV